MRRDGIVALWLERIEADPALRSLFNRDRGFVYPAQSGRVIAAAGQKITGCIEYQVIGDREGENFNRFTLFVDVFIEGYKKANQAETRIRVLTHSDTAQDLGGERLWMRYEDARDIEFPSNRAVTHRQIEFDFEAVRDEAA